VDVRSPWPGVARMVPVLACAAVLYGVLNHVLLPDAGVWVRCVAAALFGITLMLPLLHVMHDSSHASIGGHEGWWKALGRLSVRMCPFPTLLPSVGDSLR
jgi:hypothetical protein